MIFIFDNLHFPNILRLYFNIMTKKAHSKATVKQQKASHHIELDKILSLATEYAKMYGFPIPPIEKVEKMIREISQDVERMFVHNKSKKQLQGGDILILMLKVGLIALVALPIIKKIVSMERNEKKKKAKARIETESMVD